MNVPEFVKAITSSTTPNTIEEVRAVQSWLHNLDGSLQAELFTGDDRWFLGWMLRNQEVICKLNKERQKESARNYPHQIKQLEARIVKLESRPYQLEFGQLQKLKEELETARKKIVDLETILLGTTSGSHINREL